MHKISNSVTKKDHDEKVSGSVKYVGDYPQIGMLHGKLIRSSYAHARILGVQTPELPEGYFLVDHRDIAGENIVHVVQDDSPAYADGEVHYRGEPIAMLVGPNEEETTRYARLTEVTYEVLPAILDVEESETVFFDYHYERGEMEQAFSDADQIFEEVFYTGYQEQVYLETQGMIAEYKEGHVTVRGSLQCPYYVHGAVAKVLGLTPDKVRIVQETTGGGFGGKEAFPSFLAAQTAVAAVKAQGKPVRVVFDRREDMEFTSKRHPSKSTYKVAVKDGKVTAMDIDVIFNAGAFTTLSPVVLQRGIIAAPGVYNVPNVNVRGRAVRTHTVPTGAYRGFGAPQTFFAVERMMDHIAKALDVDTLTFKRAHLVKQGDQTSTSGIYHYPVPLPAMIDDVLDRSGYLKKRKNYEKAGIERDRHGIGLSLWFHGAGFTGSGERDFIKAKVALQKTADGKVEILASNSDIGQGIKTTFAKIVASELSIPYEEIRISNPDTSRVPDSGPTVASRSLMIVGELLRRAAIHLRSEWREGEAQRVEEHFVEPEFMIPFRLDDFHGDAYPTYAWGVAAVEVKVDALTGVNEVVGCWSAFDVGTPIDLNVVVGQMEGGVLQGLGYASMEQMNYDKDGRIRNNSLSDYLIPTAMDVSHLDVQMHIEEYPYGPYGAKGAGELPLVGIPAAYVAAMEQAVSFPFSHIPLTAEETLVALSGQSAREAQKT
ncbi:MAG: xanthine dehydrogenase family protein molybdopterin-binding subunit [Clostridiales Family XIII bacterium]|jgi:CO/xanthine dehydrogenase Mo-binding subunit|nr:xanthine dehydrogenase family protein molybdopterin-binding subunit [Clostridiales Family XIII bacterium]